MSHDDPERLSRNANDPQLRDLLAAGRQEVPSEEQLAALLAKLGPGMGPGGGGGGGNAAVASKAAWLGAAKWVALTAGITVAAWGVRDATRAPAAHVQNSAQVLSPQRPTDPEASASVVLEPASGPFLIPSATNTAPTQRTAANPTSKTLTAEESDPNAEVKLVERAVDALRTDPATALALANEAARRFPHGDMRQEAEVVAITALVRTGQHAAAEARANQFRRAYPTSADIPRIEVVLSENPSR